MSEPNAVVLRNKGAQIKLLSVEPHKHEETGADIDAAGELVTTTKRWITWHPVTDAEGDPVHVVEWVRFDNGSLSTLQNYYGSMEKFQEVSEEKPNEAVGVAVGVMLGVDPFDKDAMAKLNARIDPEEFVLYQVVVMAMLSIANGVDPTKAARMIEEGRLGVKEQVEAANKAIEEALDEQEKERVERKEKEEKEAKEAAAKAAAEAGTTEPPPSEPASKSEQPPTDPPLAPATPGTDGSGSGSASDAPTTSSGV